MKLNKNNMPLNLLNPVQTEMHWNICRTQVPSEMADELNKLYV